MQQYKNNIHLKFIESKIVSRRARGYIRDGKLRGDGDL